MGVYFYRYPKGTSMKAMEELKDQNIVSYKAPEFQVC